MSVRGSIATGSPAKLDMIAWIYQFKVKDQVAGKDVTLELPFEVL